MNDELYTRVEKQTGWSRELLYQLVDNVRDYAIFVCDTEGRIVSWNVGAEKIFGYKPEEAIGQKTAITFTEEDRANGVPEHEMRTAREEGCAEDERWHVRKDGGYFFASGVKTPLYDDEGTLTGYAKIARDVTERIRFQDQLREAKDILEMKVGERTRELSESNESLRLEVVTRKESEQVRVALLRKIVQTQEDERKRIAREIHDHIGQQITAVQLHLHAISEENGEDARLSEKLGKLQAIVDRMDAEADFLAWELRPSVLDNLGLAAALRDYINEWSKHFKTPAHFQQIGFDGQRLLPETEINLYRIGQEALNNIAKHAGAGNVYVLLERRGDSIVLIVEDDGVGFDASKESVLTGDDRGMGLLGMKERAELVGGSLEIESSRGNGTTVYARVPARFEEDIHSTAS
ncbi:MAG TPA: PAS domain-containing sensor histidine kinase [Pyrinomonadaceae bacterium]|jgi:PAS domain S-box-containing protein